MSAQRKLRVTTTGYLTPEEQATLLDIVRRYHAGDAAPQVAMAWVYGLVSNSALWPADDRTT